MQTPGAMNRVLFVAGARGAVGRNVVRLGEAAGARLIPHVRPKSADKGPLPANAAVLELTDLEALTRVLRGATTIIQLIGTMRKRFAAGDTYETSDIGTTRQLVDAAKAAGTIDHLVLLSSVGAGRPVGAYLKAKAEAERIVRESGIPFTLFRPSAFVGEGHEPPQVMGTFTRLLGLRRLEPIRVEELAGTILHVAQTRSNLGQVLEGEKLWEVVSLRR